MPFFCFVHQSFTNVKFFERHTGKHITDGQCVQNGIVEQFCPKALRTIRPTISRKDDYNIRLQLGNLRKWGNNEYYTHYLAVNL